MSNGEIKVNGEGGLRNETINFQFKSMLYGEMGKNLFPNLIQPFLKNTYGSSRNDENRNHASLLINQVVEKTLNLKKRKKI